MSGYQLINFEWMAVSVKTERKPLIDVEVDDDLQLLHLQKK
jgi:hypothetical protein